VPLADVVPGLYVIHVEARSRVGNQPTVNRDIPDQGSVIQGSRLKAQGIDGA
jgi:hypothetical protein